MKINLQEVKEKYPDVYQAIFDEGKAAGIEEGKKIGHKEGLAEATREAEEKARAEGAKAERERIQSVEAQLIPGHEALIKDLKYDGETTGEQAAVKILAAEKKMRQTTAGQLDTDAPPPVTNPPAPEVEGTKTQEDTSRPIEERAKEEWDKDAKLRSEFTGFESYLGYRKAVDSGRVKVLGKK